MVSSPEEYFNTQDFSPNASSGDYTATEKLFMQKYLGMNEEDLLSGHLKAAPAKKTILARQEASIKVDSPKETILTRQEDSIAYIESMSFEIDDIHEQPVEAPAFIQKAALPVEVQDDSSKQADSSEEMAVDATIIEDEKIEAVDASPLPEDSQAAVSEDQNPVELEEPVAEATLESAEPEPVAEAPLEAAEPEPVAEATLKSAEPEPVAEATLESAEPEPVAEATLESSPELETIPEPIATAPEEPKVTTQAPDPIVKSSALHFHTEYERIKAEEPPLESILKQESRCQMVAFFIGNQEFVVPTMAMQEVIRFEKPIRIPVAPAFVEGVITLRGRVSPVVNLRSMLEVTNKPRDEEKCIIICLRRGIQLGFVVEKIHTMYWVPQEDLEWAVEAQLGINPDVDFISAVMKCENGNRLIGMLSVDKIIDFILR